MRIGVMVFLLVLAALARVGAEPLIYTGIDTDVDPELRGGQVFAPVNVVCKALDAAVAWDTNAGTVSIRQNGQPEVILTPGSPAATIGGKTVALTASPYVKHGRTMVPVRFLAESLGVPVTYHAATRTVRFPVGNRLYILPLIADRGGILFESPAPGATVGNPILLQGVGNVFEGDFPIELQVKGNGTIASSFAVSGMGGWYPFSTRLYYNNTRDETLDAAIVAYDYGGRDDEAPTKYTVKVRLLPTE